MNAAPVGACVAIYYDGLPLMLGDYLQTPTGRTYAVFAVRIQHRGLYVGRQHLRCLVQPRPPSGARVLPLIWYRRQRKAAPFA